MRRMLSMRDLKAQDLQGLTPEDLTALAVQMLEHIEQQGRDLDLHRRDLQVKQKLIERKDRDIAWRDAKLEKVTFELARLKRWKFGAKFQHRTTFPHFRRSKFPHPVAVPVLSRRGVRRPPFEGVPGRV